MLLRDYCSYLNTTCLTIFSYVSQRYYCLPLWVPQSKDNLLFESPSKLCDGQVPHVRRAIFYSQQSSGFIVQYQAQEL